MKNLKITIWDLEASRISRIERKLYRAMQQLQVTGIIDSQSEPPLLSRMNMVGKIPALEINGMFWTQKPGVEFSEQACIELLEIILKKM